MCNHQGAYDIFAYTATWATNFRWMMKASLRKIPFVGLACSVPGSRYMSTSRPSACAAPWSAPENQLRGGMSLVEFSEGARTPDGRMHRFRRGAFLPGR